MAEIQRRGLRIIQSVLVEGKNRVRVYQPDGAPLAGFEPVTRQPGGRLPAADAGRRAGRRRRRAAASAGARPRPAGRHELRPHRRRLRPGARPHLQAPAVLVPGLPAVPDDLGAVDRAPADRLGGLLGRRHQGLGHLGVQLRPRPGGADAAALRLLRLDRGGHGGGRRRRGARSATCCSRRRSAPPSTSGGSSWRSSPASSAPSASTSCFAIFFNHGLPNPAAAEIRGPFAARQLPAAGPDLRPADARLLSRGLLLPRRALAAAGDGLPLPHRLAGALRLLPLGLVAHLARPADQPAADAGRSRRLPLAQRDLAQARPRGGVLQPWPASGSTCRSSSRAWPSWRLGLAGVGLAERHLARPPPGGRGRRPAVAPAGRRGADGQRPAIANGAERRRRPPAGRAAACAPARSGSSRRSARWPAPSCGTSSPRPASTCSASSSSSRRWARAWSPWGRSRPSC